MAIVTEKFWKKFLTPYGDQHTIIVDQHGLVLISTRTYLEKTTQTLFLTPHDDQHTISFDQHTIVLISTSG